MPDQNPPPSGTARSDRPADRPAGWTAGPCCTRPVLAPGRSPRAAWRPTGRQRAPRAVAAPEAVAPPTPRAASSADLPLTGGPDFPIGLFWPPHPYQTTLARYQEISDAGFTFLITGNYQFDTQSGSYALGMADQVGLKVLVAGRPPDGGDRAVHGGHRRPDRAVLDHHRRRRLLGAVRARQLRGAPLARGLQRLRRARPDAVPHRGSGDRHRAPGRPALLPYSNLWPRQRRGDTPTSCRSYIDTVRPPLISFDRYPILTDGIDLDYFDNWVIYRDASLKSGLPAWTYIQSVGFNGHRVPTASQLAWQINISLAYGCKGIQYFTYWTPDPARGEGYTQALITVDGHRTPLYDARKALNHSWLQPVGRQLKPLVSESVQHANDNPLPPGATAFTPGDHLTAATGDAAVLGLFRPAQDDGTRYLLVTNRNPDQRASVRIGLNAAHVKRAAYFVPATNSYRAVGGSTALDVRLDAGAAALYRLSPS